MYKYQYGIKEVQLYHTAYNETAVYVSRPFTVEGTIAGVSIETEENHPIVRFDHSDIVNIPTSLEYYITAMDRPTPNQWIPILPKGQTSIVNERLLVTGKQAALRFQCNLNKPITVYKNLIPLDKTKWTIALKNGQMYVILDDIIVGSMIFEDIFTIDYFPDYSYRSPWDISLDTLLDNNVSGSLQTKTDAFNGADYNGNVWLSEYPYVDIQDRDSFNSATPISITLTDANITGPKNTVITKATPFAGTITAGEAYTKNITDYSKEDWRTREYKIRPYDSVDYPIFEYYQRGNVICFAETFKNSSNVANRNYNNGDATINISYQYLVTNIRLKIILRQDKANGNDFSPTVSQYKIHIKLAK